MNVDDLRTSGRIIFETVAGSHAYATNNPNSDIDIRGFYVNPIDDYLGLTAPANQIGDDKHDTTYYSLKRAFELLQTANPNMIELLWMPQDCIKVSSEAMERIMTHREMFISKKCFHTHSGYAFAQIKKAKGQNKKVHNPQPEEMPKKEDFCWVIDDGEYISTCNMSFRPKPLKETELDLSEFHVSSMEHATDVYRLYHYGSDAKGVFRGDSMLVCESIPKEDEMTKIYGLLIYNKTAYERALKDWRSYWDWMKNRNDARWVDQEKGKLNYDQKNMMHCIRLLISGENILTHGYPIVRFEGEQLDYLMSIRNGDLEYENIMADVDKRMANLERLYKETDNIPNEVNRKDIEALYIELAKRYGA